jgi:hypothetical protein
MIVADYREKDPAVACARDLATSDRLAQAAFASSGVFRRVI